MKTLYYFRGCYGTLFLDKDGILIKYVQENDANYRGEYLDFIAKYFDGEMKLIDPGLWLYPETDEEVEIYEVDMYVKKYKEEILKAIKK